MLRIDGAKVRAFGQPWPRDVPFPFTAEQCLALCRGYAIEWRQPFEDFAALLDVGRYEMIDGYVYMKRE